MTPVDGDDTAEPEPPAGDRPAPTVEHADHHDE
jgi:hypothetical protein